METAESQPDYARVARAIAFLEEQAPAQPELGAVAAHLGLSAFHLQRLFQRWTGISPKRLLQVLTVERAKAALASRSPVLEAAFEAGLSGPGRLHDLFVALEAVTPGEFRRGGEGVVIEYGFHASPFGRALLACTERGVCGLAFCDAAREAETLADLQRHWPRARWRRSDAGTAATAARIFVAAHGPGRAPLAVVVRGTNFQVRVWQALLQIPEGGATTYERVAAGVGRPRAIRAAAGAVGDNPVAWLIPCHRVLRKTGALGGYRWGLDRKRAMLAWEAARASA